MAETGGSGGRDGDEPSRPSPPSSTTCPGIDSIVWIAVGLTILVVMWRIDPVAVILGVILGGGGVLLSPPESL